MVAILTVRDAEAFQLCEAHAAAIIARYEGRVERAIVLDAPSPEGLLRELHVVRFPNRAAFESYLADPKVLSLAALRASCIAATEILTGQSWRDYHQPLT